MKIFISHSTNEKNLAQYLASWIEGNIKDVNCFCSSRPSDLPPGSKWLDKIIKEAKASDMCLLLFSPDSISNLWLQFEAGIIIGSGNKMIIPVLYGGVSQDAFPSTLRNFQALILADEDSFESFISNQLLESAQLNTNQRYADFINNMETLNQRLLKYGEFGLLNNKNISIEKRPQRSLANETDKIFIPRNEPNREIVGIRTKIIPRRTDILNHWKFGIALGNLDNNGRFNMYFQFHCGSHRGQSTWSVYQIDATHGQLKQSFPYVPINLPAKLNPETECLLELWLSSKGQYASCVGIDNNKNRVVIYDENHNIKWRLRNNQWEDISISAWADKLPFQVDIIEMEIEYYNK